MIRNWFKTNVGDGFCAPVSASGLGLIRAGTSGVHVSPPKGSEKTSEQ
jgi:hypothetical protein